MNEITAKLDITVLNRGTRATIRRRGYRGTIIDITLSSSSMEAAIIGRAVLD